ncbi:hypothetical protein [Bdellovibrio sp. ArHS]|uniref:hypothetical protein n=1 Tax=Bdellovibrio sp. ArHS TaxID=1569284 RepID=UPI0025BD3A32|nr:hypothetical protein [Bdellovibrio sp. ArHS]
MLFTIRATAQDSDVHLSPEIITVFPTFVGGGLNLKVYEYLEFSVSYGIVPVLYYNTIADVVSTDDAQRRVINAAFKNNRVLRAALQYNVQGDVGWHVGMTAAQLNAEGSASIDEVLFAATGDDYTLLKDLLVSLGRDPAVNMKSELMILGAHFGYTWLMQDHLYLKASLGAAKVMGTKISISTGVPEFDSLYPGHAVISAAEGDLEDTVNESGLSPTLGLTLTYQF